MEELEERLNPINEKHLMNNTRENALRLTGQGATPSMGLSEYRGGGLFDKFHLTKSPLGDALRKGLKKKGGKHNLQDHLENPMKGYGMMKVEKDPNQGRPTKRRSKADDEAHMMGHHLGKHIVGLHGSGFFDSFKRGFEDIGNKIKNEFVNPNSVLRHDIVPKVEHEFQDKDSILRGKVIPIGAKVAQVAQPFLDAGVPGLGTAINTGFKVANYANQGANALGYGRYGCGSEGDRAQMLQMREGAESPRLNTPSRRRRGGNMLTQPMPVQGTNLSLSGLGQTGAYEGQGKPKRHNKRAEIVRKVMAEKGMKMIEASKYVKAHGLY
jgi:hypothetical protein